MSRVIVFSVVGLALTIVEPSIAQAKHRLEAFAPPTSLSRPKSSSWWLKAGEARQRRGDYVEAAKAFHQALGALSPKKKRANEGARAAMLVAEAYWLAFESESDRRTSDLERGAQVLREWLAQAGPTGEVSLRKDVEHMLSELKAVYGPLQAGEVALKDGRLTDATEHYGAGLAALEAQDRAWPCGAWAAQKLTQTQVLIYDQRHKNADDIERNRPLLLSALATLEHWQQLKPQGRTPPVAKQLDTLHVEIEQRLNKAEQELETAAKEEAERRQAAAEAEAEAEAAAEQRRLENEEAQRKAEQDRRRRRRVASIALLSTGVVATASGAGLLGEGIAFSLRSDELTREAQDNAEQLEQTMGANYDRAGFDADLDTYQDRSQRRTIGMLAGGSVLVVGGLVTGVLGAVWLAKNGSKRASAGERARLSPSFSRSHLMLSISRKF